MEGETWKHKRDMVQGLEGIQQEERNFLSLGYRSLETH